MNMDSHSLILVCGIFLVSLIGTGYQIRDVLPYLP